MNAGFDRVWWTIVDTHVSSLIAALLLLQFGTGPIRGFAVTLIIGLLANVFTAVFVSRTMFEAGARPAPDARAEHLRGRHDVMQIFHNANYNFIRWRWHAIIAVGRWSSSPAPR